MGIPINCCCCCWQRGRKNFVVSRDFGQTKRGNQILLPVSISRICFESLEKVMGSHPREFFITEMTHGRGNERNCPVWWLSPRVRCLISSCSTKISHVFRVSWRHITINWIDFGHTWRVSTCLNGYGNLSSRWFKFKPRWPILHINFWGSWGWLAYYIRPHLSVTK